MLIVLEMVGILLVSDPSKSISSVGFRIEVYLYNYDKEVSIYSYFLESFD